jgi:transcriptional regulator of arginine metabolism
MRGRAAVSPALRRAPGPAAAARSSMATRSPSLISEALAAGGSKRDRQREIRALVAEGAIGSQQELVDRLTSRGFAVTQATVSRDIAELGLVKAPRSGAHVYVLPETFGTTGAAPAGEAARASASDERLRRILADIPVTVGRSGLILLVTGSPGTASIIAQAIDESSLTEQEGTLAGDNTLLVLFADDARLEAWRDRFDDIRSSATAESLGGSRNT